MKVRIIKTERTKTNMRVRRIERVNTVLIVNGKPVGRVARDGSFEHESLEYPAMRIAMGRAFELGDRIVRWAVTNNESVVIETESTRVKLDISITRRKFMKVAVGKRARWAQKI